VIFEIFVAVTMNRLYSRSLNNCMKPYLIQERSRLKLYNNYQPTDCEIWTLKQRDVRCTEGCISLWDGRRIEDTVEL
jgi:hypothetical protein